MKPLRIEAPLDPAFRPIYAEFEEHQHKARALGCKPLRLALERNDGLAAVFDMDIPRGEDEATAIIAERMVKTLLWVYGGFRVTVAGSEYVYEAIKNAYREGGAREFDYKFMSNVFGRPFEVIYTPDIESAPKRRDISAAIGRHMDGCRIGFDAGGSDRKVSAVIDGKSVYSEEVVWFPKESADPDYQYDGILTALKTAASHMPRVDAIGVSSAGIYINNYIMNASLFIKVPEDVFNAKCRDMYIRAAKEIGDVPLTVCNDGDVTALAGAMSLGQDGILGIAMGTSEAGGYVDVNGNITGWLNELAFVPCDLAPGAMTDEWSGDTGCGVKYFSQDAVIKLAPAAGIDLPEGLPPAEKLKIVQREVENGNERALLIFDTIGVYLGYTLKFYSLFYDMNHVLLMGRVTSGIGGERLIKKANETLATVYPELARKTRVNLPDEKSRRVGQSVAAASLPEIARGGR